MFISPFKKIYIFYSSPQTMTQPNLHPGPNHLFVSPEHLKMVTSDVANSANVLEGSSYVTPSQISSARIGIFLFLHMSIISSLCSQGQHAPNGFEGSLTQTNLVFSSINDYIYAKSAFQACSDCKWYILGSIPMLLAIAKLSGNPGDGKRKLSPSYDRSIIDAHIARLPPAVRNTFFFVMSQLGEEKYEAIFSLASSLP